MSADRSAARFRHDVREATRNVELRDFMRDALARHMVTRGQTQAEFADWEGARDAAAEAKWDALENLPELLEQFEQKLIARGAEVVWARDAAEANAAIVKVLREANAKSVIKSKTMTSEEIHLNGVLEHEGFEVVESDLGEFIVQLNREDPFHFVFPCMHLKRGAVKAIFERELKELGTLPTDEPEALTMVARKVLRECYLAADVGISGANFGIAETGHIAITENEGNARLTCALPRVHIALLGIEKILPRLSDLALLQPMLATAGTGQQLTCYNTIYGGPRQPGDPDGPERFVVVLLDNGRSELLADPAQRDALRCIRCGACLNVCPVFKNIGGHAYGTTYQGPIGSVITPHYRGIEEFKHLAHASSLCGACTETCPVRIDLHHHLLRLRAQGAEQMPGLFERSLLRAFAFAARRPRLYRLGAKFAGLAQSLSAPLRGTALDPVRAWRGTRELPDPPKQTFRQWWEQREQEGRR